MPGYFSLLRNFHKVTRRAGNPYLRNTACCVRRYASCDDKAPKPPKIQTFPVQQQKPKIKPCPPDEPCPKPINWKRWFQGALLLALLGLMWFLGRRRIEEDKCAKDALGQRKKPRKPKSQIRVPLHSKDLPKEVPYLLIGGGTACFAAFRAIKSNDPTAKVLVITNEFALPYMRPPLSKEMWFNDDPDHIKKLIFKQWNGTERSLFFEPPDFYVHPKELMTSENGGVAIAQGWQVSKIDIPSKIAILEDGYEIEYDKCLLAPGAIPRNLAVFERAPNKVKDHVTLYRSVRDFQALEDVVQCSSSIAIVGGGFLGSELACALAAKGKATHMTVSQIFRETGNMGRVLPEYLSKWTTEKVKQQGVAVEVQAEVEEVELSKTGQVILFLSNGKKIITDHVVVAVGVEPNTALASNSNLEVDNELGGYLVNAELEARSNLYIAGDAACFYDIKLGRRRVEHHDHAVVSGRLAGENMTGAEKPYWHQSMFWSDLGPEVGYEAIGIVDSSLPTVGVFAKATERDTPRGIVTETNEGIRSESEAKCPPQDLGPLPTEPIDISKLTAPEDYGKGVIFYLRDDIVVGIVLWNVFNRMQIARQVICEGRSYNDLNEVAKLFAIHKEEDTE